MRVVHPLLDVRGDISRHLSGGEVTLIGDPRNGGSDVPRDLPYSRQRRIEAALRKVGLAHVVRQRMRRRHEHLVSDALRAARNRAEPYAGEDVGIVALPRHERAPVEAHRVERAAARKERAPAGVAVGFFGGAFGFRRRIGQREYDGALIQARHLLEHFARERAAHGGDADDRGGLERPDGGEKIGYWRVFMRVGPLVLDEIGPALHHQPAGIHQPAAQARLMLFQTLRHHGRDHEIGDARRRLARAEEENLLVGQLAAGHAQRREDAGERHGGRALDVVVERRDEAAVLVQHPEGIVVGEILELDHHAGKDALRRNDEFIHQLIVRGAAQTALFHADVELVVEQFHVVRAHVEHHRQAGVGMHAGAGDVERELAHRNPHAIGAEVAQPENALAISDDDDPGAVRPVPEHGCDAAAVVSGDEYPARTLVDVPEALAGESHGRGVDERLHLVDVVAHHPEEERLVPVVKRVERDELVEIGRQRAQVLENARGLLLLGQHDGRQQPAQPEGVAFLLGEGGSLVERRVAQDGEPAPPLRSHGRRRFASLRHPCRSPPQTGQVHAPN